MYQELLRCAWKPGWGPALRIATVAGAVVFAVISPPRSKAQATGFAPSMARMDGSISVKELQVSLKAKREFEQGFRKLEDQDPAASLPHFAAAIQAAPSFYEAYYDKGVAESSLGQNDAALRSFQSAINLSNGHFPRAEFGYALALCRAGNAAEAERVVRHGIVAGGNIADGYIVLGAVLIDLKRFDEAEHSALAALQLQGPDAAQGHLVLADVKAERGDYAGKAREIDLYLASVPGDKGRGNLLRIRDAARHLAARMQARR